MDSRLNDASLAPELGPRKFKFTSRQGRDRRARLLGAARELLRENSPESISFADVCQKADIPRPSAYHFFPNIQAIFHGLRLLHAETLVEQALKLQNQEFSSWRNYLDALVDTALQVTLSDEAYPALIYGYGLDFVETREIGRDLDSRLAGLALQGMKQKFTLPDLANLQEIFGIALAIIDSIFRQSFRRLGQISPDMVQEAKRAATAYIKLYIPEFTPPRGKTKEDA
ncbi:MAG TPA: TetR/AcrR family transcriptional regulator [Leptospiraceae bacterium]|nr:AcrR family transcriptional regulator [Spirochaetaceae bacterium]HBS04085.1 TetR/AcrR family transcriptional regulator [Leptospiraceae bacterium]|tara:strand:- start:86394 stop:87077 length:684 start_codon:yes stop_codon:yes gene_type:complete